MAGPGLLGIEIGGTKLQLALGRDDGTVEALERRRIRPEAGALGILAQIAEAYRTLLARNEVVGERPEAAGVGFGGPVDAALGVVVRSHQVEGWAGFPLADWVRSELGIDRVVVQNDADTAGLGEARFGSGVGLSPVFYVTVGSGIGGGLILDGRIYRGSGSGAAEIGHLWVDDGSGGRARLEDVASGWAIGAAGRGLGPGGSSDVSAVDVARASGAGDPRASAILDRATGALASALAHVVTLLGPRRIILGGGVSLLEDPLWLDPIRAKLADLAFPPFLGKYDVVSAAARRSGRHPGRPGPRRRSPTLNEPDPASTPARVPI